MSLCLQHLRSYALSSSLTASRHGHVVSQGLLSCMDEGWHSLGDSGHVSQRGVRKAGRCSSSGHLGAGHKQRRDWNILQLSPKVSHVFFFAPNGIPTSINCLGCYPAIKRTLSYSLSGPGLIMGRKTQDPPHRGSVVPRPC